MLSRGFTIAGIACGAGVAAALACAVPPPTDQCVSDDDCVPASCCHATEAVLVDETMADCTARPCDAEFISCTNDEPGVRPVCRSGVCTMDKPAWCPVVELLQ